MRVESAAVIILNHADVVFAVGDCHGQDCGQYGLADASPQQILSVLASEEAMVP